MMQTGLSRLAFSAAVLSILVVSAISGPVLGQTDSADATDDSHPEVDLQAAAQWMLDQPEPVRQAAGLLMQQKPLSGPSTSPENPEALQARIADLLDQSKDPLNLALLAAVCHQAGIQGSCLDLGLADAIIENDQSNAISLGYLFPKDSDQFEEALLSVQTVDDYLFPIAEIWDRALKDYLDAGPNPERLVNTSVLTMAVVMAISVPGYGRLFDSCRNEIGESALAAACTRISELANHSGNSLTLRMIGLGLARERALAARDDALADQIDSERRNLHNRATCIRLEIPESHWSQSNDFTSNWIRSAAKLGEVGATEALGEHYNVDCPTGSS